jgi:hypothetical protein
LNVEKLLKRLKREFIKVNLIQAFLDSIILFLITNLAFFLLNVTLINSNTHYKVLLGGIAFFLIVDWVLRSRKYSLELYEEENPEFREILRTTRDNIGNEDIVTQAMFDDLLERAKNVTSESIIPSTQIIKKIILVGVLCFLTTLSGLVNIQLQQESSKVFNELQLNQITQNGDKEIFGNRSEILGESKDIESTSTELKINITGEGSEGEIDESRRLEEEQMEYKAANPGLTEDIQLAKKYSLQIREEE